MVSVTSTTILFQLNRIFNLKNNDSVPLYATWKSFGLPDLRWLVWRPLNLDLAFVISQKLMGIHHGVSKKDKKGTCIKRDAPCKLQINWHFDFLNFPTASSLLHIREILVHWPFLEISGPQKWVVGATLALKHNFLAGTLVYNDVEMY